MPCVTFREAGGGGGRQGAAALLSHAAFGTMDVVRAIAEEVSGSMGRPTADRRVMLQTPVGKVRFEVARDTRRLLLLSASE
eukprot:752509-Heterocapsa_arctica.AAC.1